MYLLQSRVKLERANVHIRDIEARIEALHQTDAARIEIHPEHRTERLVHTLDESAFDSLALVIGDAIHNLACALDYTWLQTIEKLIPANVSDRAKFPVYKAIEELDGALRKGNVDSACPALFSFMIDDIKPCDGGNVAIWPVHNFSNRDKHRLLLPVLSDGHITGIEVQDESGTWPGWGMTRDLQRPPYYIDFPKGAHITKKGKLTAHIAVKDGKSGCLMDVPDSLLMYSGEIVSVVEAFEGFLELQGF